MAYKQSPLPMVKGTKGHSSALKQLKGKFSIKKILRENIYHKVFNPRGKKVVKDVLKKGAKKGLGIIPMLIGETSKADQPKQTKSEGEQIKDLLTKHKLKGGK